MSTVPSNIIMLMNYVGFSQWLSIGATVLCLPYLRWKCPELDRPIRWEIIYKYNKSLTKIFDILQKYLYLLQNILYLTYYLGDQGEPGVPGGVPGHDPGDHGAADARQPRGDRHRPSHDPHIRPRLLSPRQVGD